jgi:SAM-dependent methyltransferase
LRIGSAAVTVDDEVIVMTHGFDQDYWERHWQQAHRDGPAAAPNPYLAREISGLAPGTALDAGCGAGAEAFWLASRGWQVTAADIAPAALARATGSEASERVRWVEADLTTWVPGVRFDLVTTHYAHPAMPQLAFYERISGWVAPGGTLLIVGHLHTAANGEHGHHSAAGADPHAHQPPAEASVTLAGITAGLDGADWTVVTAEENRRTVTGPDGQARTLHDVVVRATRRR